jgi:hypothetical protein
MHLGYHISLEFPDLTNLFVLLLSRQNMILQAQESLQRCVMYPLWTVPLPATSIVTHTHTTTRRGRALDSSGSGHRPDPGCCDHGDKAQYRKMFLESFRRAIANKETK